MKKYGFYLVIALAFLLLFTVNWSFLTKNTEDEVAKKGDIVNTHLPGSNISSTGNDEISVSVDFDMKNSPRWEIREDGGAVSVDIQENWISYQNSCNSVTVLNSFTRELVYKYDSINCKPAKSYQYNDYLVVRSLKKLIVADLTTGKQSWDFKANDIIDDVAFLNGSVFFTAGNYLYSIDIQKGPPEVWLFKAFSKIFDTELDEGAVILGTRDNVLFVNADKGNLRWSYDTGVYVEPRYNGTEEIGNYFSKSWFQLNEKTLYFIDDQSILNAVDIGNGNTRWQINLKDVGVANIYEMLLSYYEGRTMIAVDDELFAVDISSGNIVWSNETDGTTAMQVLRDTLYTSGNDRFIRAIDISSGQLRWEYQVEEKYIHDFNTPLLVSDSKIFTVSRYVPEWSPIDGNSVTFNLHALDERLGRELWVYEMEQEISDPIRYEELLIFLSEDGGLYAIDTRTGQTWTYETGQDLRKRPLNIVESKGSIVVSGVNALFAVPISEVKKNPVVLSLRSESKLNKVSAVTTSHKNLTVDEYKVFKDINEWDEITWSMPSEVLRNIPRHPVNYGVNLRDEPVRAVKIENEDYSYEISHNGKVLYRAHNVAWPFEDPVRNLYTYDGHWVFEYIGFINRPEGPIDIDNYVGNVVVDGELLNEKYGHKDIFNYTLINGRPFYFFVDEGNKVRISYAESTVPIEYESVKHYVCCSMTGLNPSTYEDIVSFFGYRDGYWYYVEAWGNE